jgi:hypothetical protein
MVATANHHTSHPEAYTDQGKAVLAHAGSHEYAGSDSQKSDTFSQAHEKASGNCQWDKSSNAKI